MKKTEPSELTLQLDKQTGVMMEQIKDLQKDTTEIKCDVKEMAVKLDNFISSKVDKDEVVKLEKMIQDKANRTDFERIETRQWYLIAGIILSLAGAIINYVMEHR
jgi:hypothetical protein